MIQVFEIIGDAVYIEHQTTKELHRICWDDHEVITLDYIGEVLHATGVSFQHHELSEGDESCLSAPFRISQLKDDANEYIKDTCGEFATFLETQTQLHSMSPTHKGKTYQVINRFGHQCGEEITLTP